jgi:hypothetical protein
LNRGGGWLKFRKSQEGSIVLEAAIIIPIFLCFLLFLITIIRIATVEMALNTAISTATKQVSTHIYPIALLLDDYNQSETGHKTKKFLDKMKQYKEHIEYAENELNQSPLNSFFPKEVKNLLSIRESFEAGASSVYTQTLRTVFEPLVDSYIDDSIILIEKLQVTKVTLPDLKDRTNPYFGLEVRYDMPLNIPFYNKELTFKKNAFERVWVGDKNTNLLDRAKSEGRREIGDNLEEKPDDVDVTKDEEEEEEEDEKEEKLVIDSILSPVQRGKQVKIIAKGPPNSSIKVTLFYQSGFVKSNNCRTDTAGWMSCSIRIGPNSKEGSYEAILTVEHQEAKGTFKVLSKANMDKYIHERKDRAKN